VDSIFLAVDSFSYELFYLNKACVFGPSEINLIVFGSKFYLSCIKVILFAEYYPL